MGKINTPLMQLIETRKKYIQDLENLPEWDRRTRQVIRWHKDELAELEKMLQPERDMIEEAHRSGQRDQGKVNKQWCRDYFTETFKSYE